MNSQCHIVLVRPKYSRNVGMVARAMSNFGLSKLILIAPDCELDLEAREGASHAQDVLQKAQIYPTWERFYDCEHEGIRIAFSAREGKNRESFDFSQSLKTDTELISALQSKPTYFIFGPEDHGLASEDLDFVHRVFLMKLPGENTSLNLSHAVLMTAVLLHESVFQSPTAAPQSEAESFFFPDQTLKRWLDTLNVDISTHTKVNAHTVLKRLLLKSFPTSKELRMLETLLQQTIRKLTQNNDPRD